MIEAFRRCFCVSFLLVIAIIIALALYVKTLTRHPATFDPLIRGGTPAQNNTNMMTGVVSSAKTLNVSSSLTSTAMLDTEYYEISGLNRQSRLVKLHWNSLSGTNENDSYNFFSAYYDIRASDPELHRPAVIVVGYVMKTVTKIDIYCLFKYANGSEKCLKRPAILKHPSPCFVPNLPAQPYHYLCEVGVGDTPPLTVRVSTSEHCEPKSTSEEIPVKNRNADMAQTPPKKFGMCIGGPLTQEDFALKDVVEFVEMSTALGAELIVLYVNETQVDVKILEHIWNYYPDTVRTVGWKRFEKWRPFHYYGQVLIISDCLYRTMYEVDYLAMIDLDEMILPVKHNSWSEMVQGLKPTPATSSFKFQNAFFVDTKKDKQATIPNCSNRTVPKYFSKTRHHTCWPGFHYRNKLMARARYVYSYGVHSICKRLVGHADNIFVPPEVALLGHYRLTVPEDCVKSPTVSNTAALKFEGNITRRICSQAYVDL